MEKKSNILKLLKDYAEGKLPQQDSEVAEEYISNYPELWKPFQQKFDTPIESKSGGYERLQKALQIKDSGKILPGQIWSVSGFDYKVLVVSSSEYSFSGEDVRVMVVSHNTHFAKKWDVLWGDMVIHTHLTGNIITSQFETPRDIISENVLAKVLQIDSGKSIESEIEFDDDFQDFYEDWYDSIHNSLTLLQNDIFQSEDIEILNHNFRLAANDKDSFPKEVLKEIYKDDNLRVDLVEKNGEYGIKFIIIDESIKQINLFSIKTASKQITRRKLELIEGVVTKFFNPSDIDKSLLSSGFEIEIKTDLWIVKSKLVLNL